MRPHFRVAVTRSISLKEMRSAEPCGHICTQAGPSGRVRHRSHLVATSTGLPSGRFYPVSTITMLPQGQRSAQLLQPMQVASLTVTSSVPTSRLMAPVGQSIMQTGSVHW